MSFSKGQAKLNSTLLETVIEDSLRLSPFTMLLIDDIETITTTKSGCWSFIPHLLHGYVRNQKAPKHVTILSLDECDKNRFSNRRTLPATSVSILSELDLPDNQSVASLLDEQVGCQLLLKNRLPGVDNVLLIDSIAPLLIAAAEHDGLEMSTKRVTRWLYSLANHFTHCLVIHHSDSFDLFVEKW